MEPQERDAPFLELSFSHHSKSLGYEPPLPLLILGSPQTKKGPYLFIYLFIFTSHRSYGAAPSRYRNS